MQEYRLSELVPELGTIPNSSTLTQFMRSLGPSVLSKGMYTPKNPKLKLNKLPSLMDLYDFQGEY